MLWAICLSIGQVAVKAGKIGCGRKSVARFTITTGVHRKRRANVNAGSSVADFF
jgi:hypothetical protein